ncbi:MAG: hypothetical protein BWY25_03279 [Chloroflexi bacterium ADurb.Bin222]|nr:MAG: hypothetical protein BWY25_03279 [Chloroflexi bacterium ADurb.Bin222]
MRCIGADVTSQRLHRSRIGTGVVVNLPPQEFIDRNAILHDPDQRGVRVVRFFGVGFDELQVTLLRFPGIAENARCFCGLIHDSRTVGWDASDRQDCVVSSERFRVGLQRAIGQCAFLLQEDLPVERRCKLERGAICGQSFGVDPAGKERIP